MNESRPYKIAETIVAGKNIFIGLYLALLISSFIVIGERALSDEPFSDNSIRVWFNNGDPDLQRFDKFSDNFGESCDEPVDLAIRGDWTHQHHIVKRSDQAAAVQQTQMQRPFQ